MANKDSNLGQSFQLSKAYFIAPFLEELEDELQKFTELMLHRHDDQCDCLADACQFAFLNDLTNIDIGVGWKQYGEDIHTKGYGF